MYRLLTFWLGALLLAGLLWAAPQAPKKEEALRCTLTDKVMTTCCCEERAGKLYCTLAKKTIEKCCCVPASTRK